MTAFTGDYLDLDTLPYGPKSVANWHVFTPSGTYPDKDSQPNGAKSLTNWDSIGRLGDYLDVDSLRWGVFPTFAASTGTSAISCLRKNYTYNPVAASVTTGITAYAGVSGAATLSRITTAAGPIVATAFRATWTVDTTSVGTGGLQHLYSNNCSIISGGRTITASVWCRSSKAQRMSLMLDCRDPKTNQIALTYNNPVVVAANTWTRLSYTGVVPDGTASISFGAYATTGTGAVLFLTGDTLDAQGFLLEISPTLNPYFDGTTVPYDGYAYLPGVAGNYVSAPDSVPLSITGDIDIRCKVALADWTPAAAQRLVTKWEPTNGLRSFDLYVETSGVLYLRLSTDGTNSVQAQSSAATAVTDGTIKWVRATWRTSDGRVQFFLSNDGITWTQLGTNQSIALASIYDGAHPLEIGSYNAGANPVQGKIYQAQIRNNVLNDGTGIVFDADFSSMNGTTTFTESSSNAATVTLNGTISQFPDNLLYGGSWTGTANAAMSVLTDNAATSGTADGAKSTSLVGACTGTTAISGTFERTRGKAGSSTGTSATSVASKRIRDEVPASVPNGTSAIVGYLKDSRKESGAATGTSIAHGVWKPDESAAPIGTSAISGAFERSCDVVGSSAGTSAVVAAEDKTTPQSPDEIGASTGDSVLIGAVERSSDLDTHTTAGTSSIVGAEDKTSVGSPDEEGASTGTSSFTGASERPCDLAAQATGTSAVVAAEESSIDLAATSTGEGSVVAAETSSTAGIDLAAASTGTSSVNVAESRLAELAGASTGAAAVVSAIQITGLGSFQVSVDHLSGAAPLTVTLSLISWPDGYWDGFFVDWGDGLPTYQYGVHHDPYSWRPGTGVPWPAPTFAYTAEGEYNVVATTYMNL